MIQSDMPKYRSHKTVWALKIAAIDFKNVPSSQDRAENPTAVITPVDSRYASFEVSAEYVSKHKPQNGGYFVVYDDGYQSWSPAEAFEGGYTLITNEG